MAHWRALTLLLLIVFVASCATNPVTGKKTISLMSESQEESLGAEADVGIVAQYGVLDDPALTAYIDSLGQLIVPVSHVPEEDFVFRLLDDPVVNAFALPGGYVYITRGILAYLNDEAGLIGVMGHEVGHVAARHSADRYTKQILVGAGLGLGSALSETVAKYAQVAGVGAQLMLLKYGRDDERQSDELGVQYGTALGYDTREMAEFFGTLDQLSGGSGGLPSWASTHPDPGERYDTVLRLSAEAQAGKPGPFRRDRGGFLTRLEGLTFGPDPRQGFVHEDAFVHPELAIRFPRPADWKLQNLPSQVQMASPDGDAAIFFRMRPAGNPTAAAQDFATEAQVAVSERHSTTIAGWPAVVQLGEIANEQSSMTLQSTFISRQDGIFVFHGLSTTADFNGFQSTFTSVAQGFTRETDRRLLEIRPITLQIVQAREERPFAEQVAAYPIPEGAGVDLSGLALMNGFTTHERVPAGTHLKVLRR